MPVCASVVAWISTTAWPWTSDDMIVGVALLTLTSWHMLRDEDISLLVCGEEVMSVYPHTTGYLKCHVADTVNYSQSVLPFCIDVHHEVIRVDVFDEHGIKLHLVPLVDKND